MLRVNEYPLLYTEIISPITRMDINAARARAAADLLQRQQERISQIRSSSSSVGPRTPNNTNTGNTNTTAPSSGKKSSGKKRNYVDIAEEPIQRGR